MNYDTKSYRKLNNIPMDLKVGYRNVWADRMPLVLKIISQGGLQKRLGRTNVISNTNDRLRHEA